MRTLWGIAALVAVSGVVACSSDDSAGSLEQGTITDAGNGGSSTAGAGNGGQAGTAGSGAGRGGRTGAGGARATGGANQGGASQGGSSQGGAAQGGGGQGGGGQGGAGTTYGQTYSGGLYHLGPVDYEETQWHNACAPGTKYGQSIRQLEGNLLAGLWNGIPDVASYCDACILVTTAAGKSAVLRVVTYGDTSTNSIDVSPEAYAILNVGENPRSMTWQFTKCPDTGELIYEFQTGSNQWWTSLWVRNARVPVEKVEVQSANHASYVTLQRGSDGTLTDGGGFGAGQFSIRLTGRDGQVVTDSFAWPSAGIAGAVLTGAGNFE